MWVYYAIMVCVSGCPYARGNKWNEESVLRKLSYKKLWKLLIDLDINKKTLSQMADISASTLTKLSKGESVNMEIIMRICNALDCEIHDVVELVDGDAGNLHQRNTDA